MESRGKIGSFLRKGASKAVRGRFSGGPANPLIRGRQWTTVVLISEGDS